MKEFFVERRRQLTSLTILISLISIHVVLVVREVCNLQSWGALLVVYTIVNAFVLTMSFGLSSKEYLAKLPTDAEVYGAKPESA